MDADLPNVALLLLLYCLQGIPLGLVAAIPFLLQKKRGFSGQALFSLSTWPFAAKVMLAPLVDSVCFFGMGPRKSWLIFSQLGIALVMYFTKELVGTAFESNNINQLMLIFFILCTFAAIQDIAVDGWALTMLRSENLNWASTCNTVGQSLGLFIGNSLFMALNSPTFCLNYLNQQNELVTISSFFGTFGFIYLFVSIVIIIGKREKFNSCKIIGILPAYKSLLGIIQHPNIKSLAAIHFTSKIAFAAMDNLFVLELSERGLGQDTMAIISTFFYSPIQILLPLILAGNKVPLLHPSKPFDLFIKSYPFRIFFAFLLIPLFFLHDQFDIQQKIPWTMLLILIVHMFYRMTECSMFVSQMAFHAHVSEKEHYSGTFMTLMNTLANVGVQIYISPTMKFAELLGSIRKCSLKSPYWCLDVKGTLSCSLVGGICQTIIDPFYIVSTLCIIFGLYWYRNKKKTLINIQNFTSCFTDKNKIYKK